MRCSKNFALYSSWQSFSMGREKRETEFVISEKRLPRIDAVMIKMYCTAVQALP